MAPWDVAGSLNLLCSPGGRKNSRSFPQKQKMAEAAYLF